MTNFLKKCTTKRCKQLLGDVPIAYLNGNFDQDQDKRGWNRRSLVPGF